MAYPVRAYRRTTRSPVAPADPYKTPYNPPKMPGGGGGYAEPLRRNPDIPQRHYEGGNQMRGLIGAVFGRNPWIAGFKIGWFIGDKIMDALGWPEIEWNFWRAPASPSAMGLTLKKTCPPPATGLLGGQIGWGASGVSDSCLAPFGQPFVGWPPVTIPNNQHLRTWNSRAAPPDTVTMNDSYVDQVWQNLTGASKVVPATAPIWNPVWKPGVWVDPMVYPPAVDRPFPEPRPYDTPPSPLPEASTALQPSVGAYAGGQVLTKTFARTQTSTRMGTYPNKSPPGRRTKERKLKLARGIVTFVHAINGLTELGDLIEALYKSVDPKCAKKLGASKPGEGKAKALARQSRALWRCFPTMDWDTAVFNIIWTNIEDRIWATQGISTKNLGRAYGSNIGVNKILSDAYGDQVANFTNDIEGWIKPRIAHKLGLTLR